MSMLFYVMQMHNHVTYSDAGTPTVRIRNYLSIYAFIGKV